MKRWTRPPVLIGVGLLIVAIAVLLAIAGDDGPGRPADQTPTRVLVDGADPDTRRDDVLPLDERTQDVLDTVASEDPDVGPHKDLNAGATPEPIPGPLATQSFPGCRTQFVRNQSTRSATPRLIVWHYTVSRDVPGWADNNALTAMANNPANGVSWHFSIGRADGNCAYNVPLLGNAWTQGRANSFSVGIEVIALGNEGEYVTGAGRKRLLAVTREAGRRLGIPMQRGAVSNCVPTRPGIIRHIDLGACGGGHHDITPMTGYEGLLAELAVPPVPAKVTERCRKVARYRRTHDQANRWQRARVARMRAAGYWCDDRGRAHRRKG